MDYVKSFFLFFKRHFLVGYCKRCHQHLLRSEKLFCLECFIFIRQQMRIHEEAVVIAPKGSYLFQQSKVGAPWFWHSDFLEALLLIHLHDRENDGLLLLERFFKKCRTLQKCWSLCFISNKSHMRGHQIIIIGKDYASFQLMKALAYGSGATKVEGIFLFDEKNTIQESSS